MSGAALSDSMTFDNATFASLGVTPGTYVWSWGTGLPHQNFTLIIGSGVPDDTWTATSTTNAPAARELSHGSVDWQ